MKKINSKIYCLYVNLTTSYISFKIEQGKFLGELKEKMVTGKKYFVVEHLNDSVNYVQLEDIFETEEKAFKALAGMLKKKCR